MVVVHILDKNDNRPAFDQVTYIGHVSEGSSDGAIVLAEDSVPLILTADDKDSNLNALLLYSILEPEARVYFSIDANTGALRTAMTPDREMRERFEFTVQVQDQGKHQIILLLFCLYVLYLLYLLLWLDIISVNVNF